MDEFNDAIDLEENEEGKYEVPEDERTWWQKVKDFFRDYASLIFPIIGSLLGIGLKTALDRKEYDSTLYTTDEEGNVYKTKAKKMHTISPKKSKKAHIQKYEQED